jgi:hypothetical protein
MERNALRWMAMVIGLLLAVECALAAPSAPNVLEYVASSRRDLSSLPNQSLDAIAGNVTQLNINAMAITNTWQGYYGNVSGAIVLMTSDNKTFYNWTMSSTKGEIYATRSNAVSFTTLNCTNSTNLAAEDSALGANSSDIDSVTNTFMGTTHPQFYSGTLNFLANRCNATNAFDNTGSQATKFFQVLLQDDTNNILYTTLMNGAQTGFDGNAWDFEMLVGENGHGNSASTAYYFFVELG